MTKRQSDRGFGLMFAGVFAVVFALIWWASRSPAVWPAAVALAFLALALIAPVTLLPLNRLWAAFARRLGAFNNRLVLGLFFIVIIVPMGLIIRLMGRDPMARRRDPAAATILPSRTMAAALS